MGRVWLKRRKSNTTNIEKQVKTQLLLVSFCLGYLRVFVLEHNWELRAGQGRARKPYNRTQYSGTDGAGDNCNLKQHRKHFSHTKICLYLFQKLCKCAAGVATPTNRRTGHN